MLFDGNGNQLALGQDVGRHNALDKAIGEVFLSGRIKEARIGVLSSRISYELVQKAARAQLPILVALSRPTALAVKLGEQMNMTLAWLSKREGLFVFCGNERFDG
jgi:FdhD protein